MGTLTIYALLWSILIHTVASSPSCPYECSCQEGVVKCEDGADLRVIPRDIPEDTTSLHLEGNAINSIDDLPRLDHLKQLFLSYNQIQSIPENILDRLPSLERLHLIHNSIQYVPQLSSVYSSLQELDIRHNEIASISPEAFSAVPDLLELNVEHNKLRSLPTTIVDHAEKLEKLSAAYNPLRCDCRIKKLQSLLDSSSVCNWPGVLRAIAVADVSKSDLACESPKITYENFDTKILHCAYNDGVIWLYKEEELSAASLRGVVRFDNGSLLIPRRMKDNHFQCSTERAHRSHTKRSIRVSHVPMHKEAENVQSHKDDHMDKKTSALPSFTLRPVDNTYREGTAVDMHCEVTGSPRPVVDWYFRGARLINSRKHEISQGGQKLKIYPFLESDVGSYTCRASNVHGTIEALARIDLISSVPPQIFDAPHVATVNPGEQVTFRCNARGVPRPHITWFFDGSEIPVKKGRFSVNDDGSELIISHVSRQDDGVIACMAANPVGSIMADARLNVRKVPGLDEAIDNKIIKEIVDKAKMHVDKAIAQTKSDLQQGGEGVKSITEMKKLFRFSVSDKASELSKAREIYEESIRLVNAHVARGLNFVGIDLSGKNVSYESVLAPTHVHTIMELSGCQAGLFKEKDCSNMCFHNKYRSYDGQCNNLDNPTWGVSQWPLKRHLPARYENGFNTPAGWNEDRLYNGYKLPNARLVSRQLISTREITPHSSLSAFVMQWGQLMDHDITHTPFVLSRNSYTSGAICNRTCENTDPCFNIQLLPDDPKLQKNNEHHRKFPCIEFERSGAICGSGETSLLFQRVTQREQMNIVTSYMDASFLYGSTEVQALELRDLFSDHGLMRFDIVSAAQKPYLPFEKDSLMDCRRNTSTDNPIRCFLAGDLRANEQLGLTSMQTVFLREHNRVAAKLLEHNPVWDGEKLYQEARKIVGAQVQHITFTYWLPLVLGKSGYDELIGPYPGYDPTVDATVANVFSAAAFRFGHTLINPKLRRLDKDFKSIPQGDIPLHEAFFAPERMLSEGGVDPLLRGLFATPLKLPKPNELLNSELTEKLFFNRDVDIALDLASLNIQRSRDHGLPAYVEYRRFCNLSIPESWDDIKMIVQDEGVMEKMKTLYGHPGNIDVWVGGITERRLPEGLIGPLFACIISDQFRRMRAGDRFWYENPTTFTPTQLQQIKKATLARILCDNGDMIDKVQKNVFLFPGNSTQLYEKCENHPSMNLAVFSSCCDTGCDGALPTDTPLRKRRNANEKPSKACTVKGRIRKDGAEWRKDKCTICHCKNGAAWCNNECEKII